MDEAPTDSAPAAASAIAETTTTTETSSAHRRQPRNRRRPAKKTTSEAVKDVDGEVKPSSNKKCKFFKINGYCRFGDKCRFKHVYQPKTAEVAGDQEETSTGAKTTLQPEHAIIMPSRLPPKRFVPVKLILNSSQVGSEEQKKARVTDITYLKRRFAPVQITNAVNGETSVKFTYKVVNPEWVFDVNSVTFILTFAAEHPLACASVDIEQGQMPGPLHVYLVKKFNEIIKAQYDASVSKDRFEPIGKWFIREVDRNILELFIVGLKRTKWLLSAEVSGLKVTVFDTPVEEKRELTTLEKIKSLENKDRPQKENDESADEDENGESSGPETAITERPVGEPKATSNNPKSAEIKISANWSDSEQSVGTITFIQFSGAARCLRCGTQEFFDVAAGKEQTWKCKKCSTIESIKFESVLGHQNSNVFGHVYPRGCRPVDCILLSSKLKVACMNCSKDFIVEALPYGTPSQSWCRQCNAKIRFAIDSILFHGLFGAIPDGDKGTADRQPKKKNLKDDIMLTHGTPLPKNGTCKHYGKSFRWFRFPCCGKLYPCDQCHADHEKDHEMKLANRMVCGFCSFEQPFVKDSCKHCKENIIKVRTTFWEGGKGMRDQKAMSKNDKKKYTNTNKTIPTKRTGPEAKLGNKKQGE